MPTMLIQITVILYALATIWQGLSLLNKTPTKWGGWLLGLPAMCLHGYLLYRWIDVGDGQNLYFFNVFSLMMWMSAGLVLVSALRKPVHNLLIFIFPLAILSIFLVNRFNGMYMVDTGAHLSQFIHVVLSTLAISILGVAALQALLLFMQDIMLRHKRGTLFLRILPPVETLESLLFEIIGLGFLLLSTVLALSFTTYTTVSAAHLTHSPYLAILAWFVFAVLLWGRYRLGWRGRTAIRWTVSGVAILTVSYFGNWVIAAMLG